MNTSDDAVEVQYESDAPRDKLHRVAVMGFPKRENEQTRDAAPRLRKPCVAYFGTETLRLGGGYRCREATTRTMELDPSG